MILLFWKTLGARFPNCAFLFGVRQDQNALGRNKTFKPSRMFLRAKLCRKRGVAVVWAGPPAQWPEAFTAATGENKRVYRGGHVKVGGVTESRKLPFLFPKRDVYGRRCLSRYPFQKRPSSFRSDPLLRGDTAAIGLGLGILMADKIKPSIRQGAAIALVAIGALAAARWLVKLTLGQINRPESEWGRVRARVRSIRGDSGYTS